MKPERTQKSWLCYLNALKAKINSTKCQYKEEIMSREST